MLKKICIALLVLCACMFAAAPSSAGVQPLVQPEWPDHYGLGCQITTWQISPPFGQWMCMSRCPDHYCYTYPDGSVHCAIAAIYYGPYLC